MNTNFNPKENIKSWILENPMSVIYDCNTIQEARDHGWMKNPEFGGGNFLMGIGLFACLSFLAKIHKVMTDSRIKLKSGEIMKVANKWVKNHSEELKELEIEDIITVKPEFFINEKDAFIRMIKAYEKETKRSVGVKPNDLIYVWDIFRNKFHHFGRPGEAGRVIAYESTLQMKFNDNQDKIFSREGNFFTCNVDLLKDEVGEISRWLSSKVDENNSDRDQLVLIYIKKALTTDFENSST